MHVVVVGAGVLGASAAYHLARDGLEVTLVDRADEGRATAAGAGIVCPWGSTIEDAASYALLAGGARYYQPARGPAWPRMARHDLGYARVGGLYVPAEPQRTRCARAPGARPRRRCAGSGPHRAPVADGCPRPVSAACVATSPPCSSSGGARVDGRRLAAALQRAAVKRQDALHERVGRTRPPWRAASWACASAAS